jgi:bis(5'-nucleosyl)-tetraphosphatase (symmetrical)
METKSRTIFIGDPHSCCEELQELIKTVQYDPKHDRVIVCGDLTDRGVAPIETISYVRQMGFDCLMGNHDKKIIKWADNKKAKSQYPDYYFKLTDDDINFIRNLPYYIELDSIICIHAGIKPNIQMPYQSRDDLIYLRYTDLQGRFVSLRQINKYGKEATGAIFWTSFGPFLGKDIVYGHQVHSLTDVNITKYDDGTACYGIDTGCCFGGHITALISYTDSKEKEIVQVQAKREYYASTFDVC